MRFKKVILTIGFSTLTIFYSHASEEYELLRPQLIMVTLGANDFKQLSNFYENVFNFKFLPSLSDGENANHAYVSAGMFLGVNKKYGTPTDQSDITLHFHVPNIDKYEEKIIRNGGNKIYPPLGDEKKCIPLSIAEKSIESIKSSYTHLTHLSPENITNSLGNFALYEDSEKNHISLIQLEKWAHPYYTQGKLKDDDYKEAKLNLSAEPDHFPDYDEGYSCRGDRSALTPYQPMIADKGYLHCFDRFMDCPAKVKLSLPKTQEEKTQILLRMKEEKKPEITDNQYKKILKTFLREGIEDISPQSIFDEIWAILLHNNIYIRQVNNALSGYVFEFLGEKIKNQEMEDDYIYTINGDGRLSRYKS